MTNAGRGTDSARGIVCEWVVAMVQHQQQQQQPQPPPLGWSVAHSHTTAVWPWMQCDQPATGLCGYISGKHGRHAHLSFSCVPPPLGHGMAADSTPTPTATSPRRPPGQRRPRRRRQRRLDGGTRNSDSLGRWPRLPALIDSGHRSQFTETLAGAHPIVPSFQKRLAAAGMPCTHRSRVPTARSLRDAGLACGAFVNRNFVRLCSLGPDAFLLVRNAPASTRRRLGHRFKHSPRRGPSEVGT